MTFNPGIPQPNDLISQSQAQIQTNFSQLDTAFGIDHTAFSIMANQGQHKQVTLIAPISNPNQSGNISSVYTKTSGTGVELFYQHGTADLGVSQLTGGGITAAAWAYFTVSAGVVTVLASFNVSGIANTGAGTAVTITFLRGFGTANYAALINGYQTGTGDTGGRKINRSAQNAGSYVYNVTLEGTGAATELPVVNAVFFGVLA
jgi:hypothetical protein